VVTGGTGGLGLLLAEWLCERGLGHLVLGAHREPDEAAEHRLNALRARGARIDVVVGDINQSEVAERLLAQARTAAGPAAVFHLAGHLRDASLLNLKSADLQTSMSAKHDGGMHLARLLEPHPQTWLVLFSSVAATVGNAGQASHAAANAAMDALARQRCARGARALTVAWGAWADGGTVAAVNPFKELQRMPAQACLQRMAELMTESVAGAGSDTDRAAGQERGFAAVMDADTRALMVRPGMHPLIESPGWASTRSDGIDKAGPTVADHVNRIDATDTEGLLRLVQREAARALGWAEDRLVDPRQGFFRLGLDSLSSVDLRNRLQQALDVSLPATVAFDHPSAEDLARHLQGLLLQRSPLAPGSTPAISTNPVALEPERSLEEELRALEALLDNPSGVDA
jgi:NAD(P)-dependent dehydrogenase (short-subunit alcohol dehydrogenase family)/acyl carrier protein